MHPMTRSHHRQVRWRTRIALIIVVCCAVIVALGTTAWISPCFRYRYLGQASTNNAAYVLQRNQRLEAIRQSLATFRETHGRSPRSWREWVNADSQLFSLIAPVENGAGQFIVFHANFETSRPVILIGEPGYFHPCHPANALPRSVYGVFNDGSMDMISEPTWPPMPSDPRFVAVDNGG